MKLTALFKRDFSNPEHQKILRIADQTRSILRYSPDYNELEKHEWILTFVTDELKMGHHQHGLLGNDAQFRGYAFTASDQYQMWTRKLGKLSEAVVLDNPKPSPLSPASRVKGELYLVRPHNFIHLDKYKENTVNYDRKPIHVQLMYKWVRDEKGVSVHISEDRSYTVPAQMYVGKPEFWNDQITMDLFRRTRRAQGVGVTSFPYYLFTDHEYEI